MRKRDKMRGLSSILTLFRNELNKFSHTGAGILDSFYHMTITLLKNHIFSVKTSRFCHLFRHIIMDVITLHYQICKPLVVYQFYCMSDHSQTGPHVINIGKLLFIHTFLSNSTTSKRLLRTINFMKNTD